MNPSFTLRKCLGTDTYMRVCLFSMISRHRKRIVSPCLFAVKCVIGSGFARWGELMGAGFPLAHGVGSHRLAEGESE